MARNYFKKFDRINQSPLETGDVVVMSCPFSGTGTIPENFYDILEQCDKLSIPVMLDLAYINISNIGHLNLDYKCIQTVTTSLSKVFPVETLRVEVSDCVIFGLAEKGKFDEYDRGGTMNRLCFSRSWDGRVNVETN